MLPYLLTLIFIAWMALMHMRPEPTPTVSHLGPAWPAALMLLTLMIGFRFEVGADWDAYLTNVDKLHGEPINTVVVAGDFAYELLNWLGANVGGGIYFVNLVCGGLFCWGLATFCRCQPRPWLALLVATPYLVTVVAMGYSRQGVAIGLAMLAIAKLQVGGSVSRFVFWILLASLFHKSAIVLLPFAVFAASRNKLLTLTGVALSTVVLFVLLLQENLNYFFDAYIEAEYSSSGAAIRIWMNAIPAALFLIFKNRFSLDSNTRIFWICMAWCALLFIVILMVIPSSTAVDRVALYWIPIQLMVFSRVPDLFGIPGRRNPLWVSLVAIFSVVMMLGWLLFADTAYAWVPYRFYPWERLWL